MFSVQAWTWWTSATPSRAAKASATSVRLTSPGPAFFRQTRVGRHEKPFTCLKLRTMYVNTVDAPSHETAASAVTPLGHVLRRLKIDELPQPVLGTSAWSPATLHDSNPQIQWE